jgi:hypothetical protein
MTMSSKQAARSVIDTMPHDASLDEIIDALWAWGMAQPTGDEACQIASQRILALNPAVLVMAGRAARHASICGISRNVALDVVHALPERASLDDVLVAVSTWCPPEDAVQ